MERNEEFKSLFIFNLVIGIAVILTIEVFAVVVVRYLTVDGLYGRKKILHIGPMVQASYLQKYCCHV